MPTFTVFTNLPKSQVPETYLDETTKFIAKILKKPDGYVTIRVHPDQIMSHGGSTEPCASAELHSIGNLGPSINKGLAKEVGEYIQKKLGIKKDRFYIRFLDIPPAELGYNGTTFG